MPNSGYTVTNTFATQSGNVAASELDVNFTQPQSNLCSLNWFSNYFPDAGSAGAMAITVPGSLTLSLTAGLMVQVKVAATNTGQGCTLNVNGLGAQQIGYPPLVTFGGTAKVLPGQMLAGSIVPLIYDGTNFQYLGPIFGAGSIVGAVTGAGSAAITFAWQMAEQLCTLIIPAFSGTGSTSSFTIGVLPSYLQPIRTILMPVPDTSLADATGSISVANGAAALAFTQNGNNQLTFSKNGNPSGWASTGARQIANPITFTYPMT